MIDVLYICSPLLSGLFTFPFDMIFVIGFISMFPVVVTLSSGIMVDPFSDNSFSDDLLSRGVKPNLYQLL